MGNLGSQIGNSSHKYKVIESDAQLSLPRINQQQKVLPSKEPRPKLRSTENGKILHSGGTLTGRQPPVKTSRGNFMNAKEKVNFLKELHGKSVTHQTEQIKKCGSEPDLRYHLNQEKINVKPKRFNCTRKLVQSNSLEHSNDVENWDNTDSSTKRTGLFKTRIESRKHLFTIINGNRSPTVTKRNKLNTSDKANDNRRSLPELQKNILTDLTNEIQADECLQKLGPDKHKTSKEVVSMKNRNHETYLKEANMKKYYFGMANDTDTAELEYLNYEIDDDCTPNIPDISPDQIHLNLSNNIEDDGSLKISLHLRPILPKKQLEIPKFSSSIAWKLLYSGDSDNLEYSITSNDDDPFLSEERIEKVSSSLRLSKSIDFQFSQDKSGDSGISGDETPKPVLSQLKSKQSWTPQQDLGDDSSTDEDIKFNSIPYYYNTNKPHIFSLSLPRDHLSSQYTLDRYKNQTNVQSDLTTNKLKRSVSGGFGNDQMNNDDITDAYTAKNSNWLLSKSAPNSLNNGFTSLESTYIYDEALTSLVPVSSQHSKGRIMYLPHNEDTKALKSQCQNTVNNTRNNLSQNLINEVEKKEQLRIKEIEAMQRIEEEFRQKRSRYNSSYINNQQDFRKVMLSVGEKSV